MRLNSLNLQLDIQLQKEGVKQGFPQIFLFFFPFTDIYIYIFYFKCYINIPNFIFIAYFLNELLRKMCFKKGAWHIFDVDLIVRICVYLILFHTMMNWMMSDHLFCVGERLCVSEDHRSNANAILEDRSGGHLQRRAPSAAC